MDIITSMIYESNFKAATVGTIEKFVKGKAHVYFDRENDTLRITIIDPYNKTWAYEVYGIGEKLYNGISANTVAHEFIRAYEKKIFRNFFK